MAGNEQLRIEAFELAAGVNESVISRWQETATTEASFQTDRTLCSPGHSNPDSECDGVVTLTLDASLLSVVVTTGADVEYASHYLGEGKAPRGSGEGVETCAFYFEVETDYDNSLNEQGVSRQSEGIYITNPVARDCVGISTSGVGDLDKYAHLEFM